MLPFGPNWYASVMGTGIVAIALTGLPYRLPGATGVALAFWLLDLLLLAAVTAAAVHHWRRDRATARGRLLGHLDDAVMSHFYGATAMGLMTAGAATALVGRRWLGDGVAIPVDAVLWSLGTLFGLFTAVAVPYRAITSHEVTDESAFGGWLMPIVPPMVTAATGTVLLPHLPSGQAQQTMLLFLAACFGLTVVFSLLVLATVWQKLLRHGVGAAGTVPTLWIVLGPLGQSITAAHHLGAAADGPAPAYAPALRIVSVVYGVPVWGFAMVWLALASALTIRQVRRGLPFALTWWSFTFPLGTVVTGTSALATLTGLVLLKVLAVVLFLGLVAAWATVAVRTGHALVGDGVRATRRRRTMRVPATVAARRPVG